MAEDLLAKLKAIDLAILSDVVQQDQGSKSFEITEWSVRRLSDKRIINPDGLWLFRGTGRDNAGARHWSLVLKILERQEPQLPPSDLWYWKREFLFAQSGLVENLSGPVKAARIYRAEETEDGAWLWLEYIENHRPDPWLVDDYAFVARKLGYWNGIWANTHPLPTEPWLTMQPYRSWYSETNPEQDFKFPLNRNTYLARFVTAMRGFGGIVKSFTTSLKFCRKPFPILTASAEICLSKKAKTNRMNLYWSIGHSVVWVR